MINQVVRPPDMFSGGRNVYKVARTGQSPFGAGYVKPMRYFRRLLVEADGIIF